MNKCPTCGQPDCEAEINRLRATITQIVTAKTLQEAQQTAKQALDARWLLGQG